MSEESQSDSENEIIEDVPEQFEITDDMAPADVFRLSPMTLTDYLEQEPRFTTIEQHEQALRQCIARTVRGFIVKYRERASFRYEILNGTQLASILSFFMPYTKTTPAHTSSAGRAIAAKTTEARYNPYKDSLTNARYQVQLAFFGETALISADPHVLSLYVPPTGPYDRNIIVRFIQFMESRVNNPQALHEELSAHAFRSRNPDIFIRKVFIHYSAQGNSGKTFFANTFVSSPVHDWNKGARC